MGSKQHNKTAETPVFSTLIAFIPKVHLDFWILGGVTAPAAAWLIPLRVCFPLFPEGIRLILCIFEQEYTIISLA